MFSSPTSALATLTSTLCLLLCVGCGDDGDSSASGGNGGQGSGGQGGGAGGQGSGGNAQFSLDNCETNIAGDVPDFYQKYFRCVDISMDGADVVIHSVGLPPHLSAYYPEGHTNNVPFDTSGGKFKVPGQGLVEQDITVTIPANPTPKGVTIDTSIVDGTLMSSTHEFKPGAAGLALNSVAYFSGAAGMGMNIAEEANTFDDYGAHHAMGTYHYHGQSPGPLEVLVNAGIINTTIPGDAAIELYAIMCDGTVVLGCTELDGSAPNTNDMDAQGGHSHDIADADATHFTNRYHTHVCPGVAADFSPEIQYYSECP